MDVIIIHPHSTIDVITNSSTELFVCDTDKSVETIKEVLEKLIDTYYSALSLPIPSFSDIFLAPKVIEDPEEFYEDHYLKHYSYPTLFGKDHKKIEKGNIALFGTTDNSIPYPMFELIEHLFNADRYHLG